MNLNQKKKKIIEAGYKAVDELIQRLEDHLKDVPPPDMSGYDGPDDR